MVIMCYDNSSSFSGVALEINLNKMIYLRGKTILWWRWQSAFCLNICPTKVVWNMKPFWRMKWNKSFIGAS